VRVYDYGEGGYSAMETDIRELLTANGVNHLPARTDVSDKTPTQPITQESYLGYGEAEYYADETLVPDKAVDYHGPSSVPKDSFAFNGIWTDHNEDATAGARAEITLNFAANDVYLVMGGSGTVEVSLDGHHLSSIDVSGVPRLYTLFSGESLVTGELEIDFAPVVQAYDFSLRLTVARATGQDRINVNRSALIVSAWVVGIPCGNPAYVFSVPFWTSLAESGPESA
jgi:hypothetical protein